MDQQQRLVGEYLHRHVPIYQASLAWKTFHATSWSCGNRKNITSDVMPQLVTLLISQSDLQEQVKFHKDLSGWY